MSKNIAIIGTVGVPGNYGGFETLADNLAVYHSDKCLKSGLTVYCSAKSFKEKPSRYCNADLHYVNIDANGIDSIAYDIYCLINAARGGHDRILLLGVSGAIILPIINFFCSAKIITNVDGIEWRRQKWKGIARLYLKFSEWIAIKASHVIIADNQGIADYIRETYRVEALVIPYGGDHAVKTSTDSAVAMDIGEGYALGLCRIEPENNVAMILDAFDKINFPLVFVGNWDASEYGRALKRKFKYHPNITILDPVYSPTKLRAIRNNARLYVHGHSAGGTNPALVEMMHFGIPVAAYGCKFNRYTTDDRALYFNSSNDLSGIVENISRCEAEKIGKAMKYIAEQRYTWDVIGKAYFDCLEADL